MANNLKTLKLITILFCLISPPAFMQANSQLSLLPIGFGEVVSSTSSGFCISSEEKESLLQSLNLPAKQGNGRDLVSFPVLEWPFENWLHQGISIVNYIDHSSTPGVVDYMCLPHAYDTHTGTDMGIYHFRAMDEGRAVIAAAGGEVVHVEYANPDRNVGFGGGPANVVSSSESNVRVCRKFGLILLCAFAL
jgi:hypothetical protein